MATLLTDTIETVLPDNRVEGERLWLSSTSSSGPPAGSRGPRACAAAACACPSRRAAGASSCATIKSTPPRSGVNSVQPLVHSGDGGAWVLGPSAADRAAAMRSLQVPDFTLPDRNGNLHSLSDHRGKKVLQVSWASW